jgi:hypothetical protein
MPDRVMHFSNPRQSGFTSTLKGEWGMGVLSPRQFNMVSGSAAGSAGVSAAGTAGAMVEAADVDDAGGASDRVGRGSDALAGRIRMLR